MNILYAGYLFVLSILFVFSYCFVDVNLQLSTIPFIHSFQGVIRMFFLEHRAFSTILYSSIVGFLFVLYYRFLRLIERKQITLNQWKMLLGSIVLLLLLSFPAFSYDVFNYMATAKVAYTWKENPWIIMPIDIPNEPALAYTRAANKVALYGPTWIALTFLPHTFGFNSIWLTIVLFKLLMTVFYSLFVYLLYKQTNNLWQTTVFAYNPLVLMEVILGGHNDLAMMFFAVIGILLFQRATYVSRILGIMFWLFSVMVKGATILLVPLFFLRNKYKHNLFFIGSCLMMCVFLITPLREEMYPWYAVWFLSFLVFLPYSTYWLLYQGSIALSLGLLLRHAPYIYMGYYEGPGPLLRILVTLAPLIIFLLVNNKLITKHLLRVFKK